MRAGVKRGAIGASVRRSRVAFAIVVLLAGAGCAAAESAGPTPPPEPPPPAPLDVSSWVTSAEGSMPLILLAPHGGNQTPGVLPDRDCAACVTVNDADTQALLYAISDAFHARIGRRPWTVVNRLSRVKFDANRDRPEATDDHAPLYPMWALWHERVDSAKARATRLHPRALLLDLHGHAHAVPRIELGYLIPAARLRDDDALLAAALGASSIARLDSVARAGTRGAPMLRGATALGTRLAALGFPAVPSAADPAPLVGQAYFDGGYNTWRHGSVGGGAVDAIQLEHNYAGVRDTPGNRAAYAEALVTALLAFLDDHYGWSPP